MKKVYFETVSKTFLFTTLTLTITYLLQYLEIDFLLPKGGNKLVVDLILEQNYLMVFGVFFTYGVVVVSLEELVFRLAPYKLWKRKLGKINYWGFGIFVALVFSLLHSIGTPGINLGFPQLALGIYLWNIINKEYGYRLCVLAHFTYNLLTISAAILVSMAL